MSLLLNFKEDIVKTFFKKEVFLYFSLFIEITIYPIKIHNTSVL